MTPRILAGAPALDRRAFPRPGSVARWFEPFHVRQPQVARGEISAQVAAGADIVVAPAWLTHRRALEAVGESRRARAWTDGAVRLAREAVEAGLERRGAVRTGPILVAGPLPDISAGPEHATGRLLPASVSDERDTHDQAGILADVGVDLLILEPRTSFDATLQATRIAVPAGRPVWAVISAADDHGEPPFPERIAMLTVSGAEGILVRPGLDIDASSVTELLDAVAAPGGPVVGLVSDQPPLADDAALDAWLGANAAALGLASGADPGALRSLVEARERLLAGVREREDAEHASLDSWVADAARRAPGGRALWLGDAHVGLPTGFDWTVVPTGSTGIAALPAEAFRLVIAPGQTEPQRLARVVERGGIVALVVSGDMAADLTTRLAAVGLRVQDIGSAPDDVARVIARREDA
ncbi:MAG: homocysteine S-methyltransferase family protein [Candidatus Limnocylindrales bacterium]